MDDFSHKVYGINRQARCMTSINNKAELSEFIVGTIGLDQNNKIHRILIDADNNTQEVQIFSHKEEIWSIDGCSWDPQMLFTVTSKLKNNKYSRAGSIYRMAFDGDDYNLAEQTQKNIYNQSYTDSDRWQTPEPDLSLLKVADLDFRVGDIQKLVCNQRTRAENSFLALGHSSCDILALNNDGLISKLMSLNPNSAGFKEAIDSPYVNDVQLFDAQFIGSGDTLLISGSDGNLFGYDTRIKNLTRDNGIFSFKATNWGNMLVVDGNPNLDYQFSTGGEDGTVRVFDLRKLENGEAYQTLYSNAYNERIQVEISDHSHSHWVYSVEYNPFHDQLLLTSGSDSKVNLFNIYSLSSANIISNMLPKASQNSNADLSEDSNINIDFDQTYSEISRKSFENHHSNQDKACFDSSITDADNYNHDNKEGDNQSVDKNTDNYDLKLFEGDGVNENNLDDGDIYTDLGFTRGKDKLSEEIESTSTKHDGLIAQFDNHESSVYQSCWSKTNPWVFASLSFDGRVVVSYIPQSEKLKILL
ncbi:hypothetical protein BB561_004300 [Smittium simulii]|uniref:DUF2415 domain-containing protein n=1 Tax=Smittium simulii TaxID=133385 RepID=A0A2T9YH24_9FUNG|nr:hypothetical protein BB561_004300 [Smittium simulii]